MKFRSDRVYERNKATGDSRPAVIVSPHDLYYRRQVRRDSNRDRERHGKVSSIVAGVSCHT